MLNHIARPIARIAQRGTRSYNKPSRYTPSLDDVPVPQGSWQEHYNKKQKVNNAILGFSVVSFIATIIVAQQTGWIYLNAFPPTLDEE